MWRKKVVEPSWLQRMLCNIWVSADAENYKCEHEKRKIWECEVMHYG